MNALPNPYYERDGITIYHADCRDILPLLPAWSVDLVLTDPPYGIGESDNVKAKNSNARRSHAAAVRDYGGADFDTRVDDATISTVVSAGRHTILFGGNYYANLLPFQSGWLVWDKDNSGDFADCELAWTNLPIAVRKIRYRWNGMIQENMKHKEQRYHLTQKPIAVMAWCLSLVPDAQTILDPFMGSGTTLVAAKQLGRRAIGIEIEERYVEIAIKRLAQMVMPL